MKTKKKDNPLTVAVMAVAVVVAVWFVYHNLTATVANTPAPGVTAGSLEVKSSPKVNSQVTPAGNSVAIVPPGSGAGAGSTGSVGASPSPGTPGAATTQTPGQSPRWDEASQAPEADPFKTPYSFTAAANAVPHVTQAAPPVTPVPRVVQRTQPVVDNTRYPALPNLGNNTMRGPGIQPATVILEEAPELVGTMLGDRPSAVFRKDKGLRVVAVGERLGTWKVISVNHGGVVVKQGKREVELSVGLRQSAGAIRSEVEPPRRTESAEIPSPPITAAVTSPLPMPIDTPPTEPVTPPSKETPQLPMPVTPKETPLVPPLPPKEDVPDEKKSGDDKKPG